MLTTIIAVILLLVGATFCFFGFFSSYVINDENGFSEKFPNHHPLMIFIGMILIIASIFLLQ